MPPDGGVGRIDESVMVPQEIARISEDLFQWLELNPLHTVRIDIWLLGP